MHADSPVDETLVDETPRSAIDRGIERLRDAAPILLVVAAVFILCRLNASRGHEWGDDFALYIRQAKGIATGNVGEVIADNAVTRRDSSSPVFTPPIYPWGFPLVLAPFIALKGGKVDIALFQKLEAVLFCTFLYVWYFVLRRRVPDTIALLLTLLVGLSPWYVEWPRQVLSEFLYLTLIASAFWLIDRIRVQGLWTAGRLRPLVMLGLVIGYAFSTRRESIALIPALASFHVLYVLRTGNVRLERSSARLPDQAQLRRLAMPYLVAGGFVAGLQLVLPSAFFTYDGAGSHNLLRLRDYYPDRAAEMIGLRESGVYALFGSDGLARAMLVAFVALAVLGMAIRIFTHPGTDLPLVVFLAADWYVVGTQPFVEERYLFVMIPIAAYFVYQAVRSLVAAPFYAFKRFGGEVDLRTVRAGAAIVGGLALAPYVLGNATAMQQHTRNHREYDRLAPGTITFGAEHPQWTEMFEQVKLQVRSNELVSFFRARTLTLYTDRRALQLWDINHVLQRADWYVEQIGSDYSEAPLSPEEAQSLGFTLVWSNGAFNIWKVPERQFGATP